MQCYRNLYLNIFWISREIVMYSTLDSNKIFNQFISTTQTFLDYKSKSIPLCAAENVMSPFAKSALLTSAQEKYVMGGVLEYIEDDNFIGGENVYPFYKLINSQCNKLFNSLYADARTLTGMNAITTLLMSLLNIGDVVAYSAPDCGGHASIPDICHRLGLNTITLPYDYDRMDFDYQKINYIIESQKVNAILICISDLVNNPQFDQIEKCKAIPIIYDATQTLGLIAGGAIDNPFEYFELDYPFILMGATHKTIPGPSCALIMTRNLDLAQQIENKINPIFIRNTQMHQKMSLILTLLELEYFGKEYAQHILATSRFLAQILEKQDFCVLNQDNGYTHTHQIHMACSLEQMKAFYDNCTYFNVTLNFKTKKLFRNAGIRIGTQEISRYQWSETDLYVLGKLLGKLLRTPQIYNNPEETKIVQQMVDTLSIKKIVGFTFEKDEYVDKFNKLFMD